MSRKLKKENSREKEKGKGLKEEDDKLRYLCWFQSTYGEAVLPVGSFHWVELQRDLLRMSMGLHSRISNPEKDEPLSQVNGEEQNNRISRQWERTAAFKTLPTSVSVTDLKSSQANWRLDTLVYEKS